MKCHVKAHFASPLEPGLLSTVHQQLGQHILNLNVNMQNDGDGPSGRSKASKIDIWRRNAIFLMRVYTASICLPKLTLFNVLMNESAVNSAAVHYYD